MFQNRKPPGNEAGRRKSALDYEQVYDPAREEAQMYDNDYDCEHGCCMDCAECLLSEDLADGDSIVYCQYCGNGDVWRTDSELWDSIGEPVPPMNLW